jgi:flagellar hook assembly protein FlgD
LRGLSSIRFGLARAGEVRLELFDVSGRRVKTLVNGVLAPGPHVASWNGLNQRGDRVGNGVYFVRLTTPSKLFHARVVVLL